MVAVDINDITKGIVLTVRVKGLRKFRLRLWLTRQVLKLAARISGWRISFEGWGWRAGKNT